MKFPGFAMLAGFLVSMAAADVESRRAEAMGKPMETFRTMEGRIYRDVVITKINAGGVSFNHADGAARLRFADLSPEQRSRFGINGEDAAAVYAREARARDAYETEVEEREKARRELAEKEAAEVRATAAATKPAETIPPYPTIKRVDSGRRHSNRYSSYGSYYAGFGYAYPVRYGSSPAFRYGGNTCTPSFGTGIHFIVR